MKSDIEDVINALRHRVQALPPGVALARMPTPHEHERNGVIDNWNKAGTDC